MERFFFFEFFCVVFGVWKDFFPTLSTLTPVCAAHGAVFVPLKPGSCIISFLAYPKKAGPRPKNAENRDLFKNAVSLKPGSCRDPGVSGTIKFLKTFFRSFFFDLFFLTPGSAAHFFRPFFLDPGVSGTLFSPSGTVFLDSGVSSGEQKCIYPSHKSVSIHSQKCIYYPFTKVYPTN
ncbi:MAG: hypothetical protein EBU33_05780 [Sphingobacteriia bacterium]|nr:hypothetical protein [Sphingobacteriia bacterium]